MSKRKNAAIDTHRDSYALIVHVETPKIKNAAPIERSLEDILHEAQGLARAIDLNVIHTEVLNINKIHAGYFIGSGNREKIKHLIDDLSPDIVIFNGTLSPIQQRNLEKEWKAKVIDRTGLILEIFGARAQTKEGRLQVDLAALEYQKSRLVRSWTHLERQRGGAGFMGGPGETQIEIDRRLISERITQLKKDLDKVRRTRDLGRQSRERVPYPIVSIVGYTNAGKSTLFNHLTRANVMAEDLPFATLDPTLREIVLPHGQKAILADTVGFITDLPTQLVAAFRATLEQILYADVILHVIDISRDDYEAQRYDVIKILEEMGLNYDSDERIIEVLNKVDATDPNDPPEILLRAQNKKYDKILAVSATKHTGMKELLSATEEIISSSYEFCNITVPYHEGRAVAWLHDHGNVIHKTEGEKGFLFGVMLSPPDVSRFFALFPTIGHSSDK